MKLYYVLDPMCSWCWGFRPIFEQLLPHLPAYTRVRYVMGGLAPDSDIPMPEDTKAYVQAQWQAVSAKTGAAFNWAFWETCQPRRSTYPACRAVIAAGLQGDPAIPGMILAIQRAYYRQARNPSDLTVLAELANEIGLDRRRFEIDMVSDMVEKRLQADFRLRDQLGVHSFPTVLLQQRDQLVWLANGDCRMGDILPRLTQAIADDSQSR